MVIYEQITGLLFVLRIVFIDILVTMLLEMWVFFCSTSNECNLMQLFFYGCVCVCAYVRACVPSLLFGMNILILFFVNVGSVCLAYSLCSKSLYRVLGTMQQARLSALQVNYDGPQRKQIPKINLYKAQDKIKGIRPIKLFQLHFKLRPRVQLVQKYREQCSGIGNVLFFIYFSVMIHDFRYPSLPDNDYCE